MSNLEALRQQRRRFSGGATNPAALRKECGRLYRAALERLRARGDYVDQVNAARLEPVALTLSETFQARERALSEDIDAVLLSDEPGLERFGELVGEWEQCCLQELAMWLTLVQSQ